VHPRPPGGVLYARVVKAAVRTAIARLEHDQSAGIPASGSLTGRAQPARASAASPGRRRDWQPPGQPWHRFDL